MNPENCWKPLRANAATTEPVTADVKAENAVDWAISSRADAKAPEGSTTRPSNLKLTAAEMYIEGMTVRQIGEKIGVPHRTVSRWIAATGVKLRKPGQTAKTAAANDAEWLYEQYVTLDKSAERISMETGITPETIRRMLRMHGIEVRSTNEGRKFDPEMHRRHAEWMKGRHVGDKNPNWRGGKPRNQRQATYEYKMWAKAVKERDGQCMHCGSKEKLHAHHIKTWRSHPELRFDVCNGLTLCHSCHEKVHSYLAVRYGKRSKSTGHP